MVESDAKIDRALCSATASGAGISPSDDTIPTQGMWNLSRYGVRKLVSFSHYIQTPVVGKNTDSRTTSLKCPFRGCGQSGNTGMYNTDTYTICIYVGISVSWE
jgi:hypothetical protein